MSQGLSGPSAAFKYPFKSLWEIKEHWVQRSPCPAYRLRAALTLQLLSDGAGASSGLSVYGERTGERAVFSLSFFNAAT